VQGETIVINGESYNEGGQYIQELTTVAGCDSILTINIIVLNTVIHYDLNACESFMSNGSHMDYSEFIPSYPQPLPCATIVADTLRRDNPQVNKHSCTPGVSDSPGMCVGTLDGCTYIPGHEASVIIDIQVTPDADTAVYLTGFSFYEKAPLLYDWISGNSGPNNYPTWFRVRVLKNGTEIFLTPATATSLTWHEVTLDFFGNDEFLVTDPTTFRFELLSYCPVGNGATESVWDLDEINIVASCASASLLDKSISGVISTPGGITMKDVDVILSEDHNFSNQSVTTTSAGGHYRFDQLAPKAQYFIRGYKNTDHTNGVNTIDLIHIQKHLLGIKPFESPYQMIAADANKSNSISALDLIEIRKLLLGKYTELPRNTSWRFGVAGQTLDIGTPWLFTETYTVEYLADDIIDADFIGVKIGDVTGDAKANAGSGIVTPRGSQVLQMRLADQELKAGIPVKVDITSDQFADIAGLQFNLKMTNGRILDIVGGALPITEEYFSINHDGELLVSYNASSLINASSDQVLFSLIVMSESNGTVSEFLALNSARLSAEAYAGEELEVLGIELKATDSQVSSADNVLFANEPNPFSQSTTVRFRLAEEGQAVLRFFDLSGRVLHTVSGIYTEGINTVVIAAEDLDMQEGMVICQLQGQGFVATQKMVVRQ
jgi:hypothetical protein